ncbi:MSF1-domain-containing protein [Nadsonia fulvescens var. elongata DSM 6958]|uniref:MSF1-domain-containing protein n=1 Tax=Nadsonia fulvescens var. elongata DSM 6958 TaxID=857566 RepID=A0A1E3PHU4_9ASCO|nr:MSF1-domain-containing protein [Nadsonia fulvescens var. elongata DSM 6958]
MKIFSQQHIFGYSWEQVSSANWKKYPNEMSTHVIAVDVLRREIDPETNILKTERLLTCKQAVPRWLLTLVGGQEVSYVREVSEVDLKKRTLVLRSVNLTMNNLLFVYETVMYKPDPTNPTFATVFNQEAQITAFGSFKRLCNKIEEWSVDRFQSNASLGRAGFESVLNKVTNTVHEGESVLEIMTERVKEGVFLKNKAV